jgi:prepilin-type processing-associated H-X9-DG protein
LAKAKQKAQAIKCMSNLRQMAIAWNMYSGDNSDRLLPCIGQGQFQISLLPEPPYTDPGNQANQWVYGDVTVPTATNIDLIRLGLIYPYAPNIAIFKCPADPRTQFYPTPSSLTTPISGPLTIRSMSMNGYLNPIQSITEDGVTTSVPTAPLPSAGTVYKIFKKVGDISKMGTANCWVFVDENPYSINDGWFCPTPVPTATDWIDRPATYHGNSGAFAFADGHCEIHRFRDSALIHYTGTDNESQNSPAFYDDIRWVGARSTIPN